MKTPVPALRLRAQHSLHRPRRRMTLAHAKIGLTLLAFVMGLAFGPHVIALLTGS
jgi:hypothetical protein